MKDREVARAMSGYAMLGACLATIVLYVLPFVLRKPLDIEPWRGAVLILVVPAFCLILTVAYTTSRPKTN